MSVFGRWAWRKEYRGGVEREREREVVSLKGEKIRLGLFVN